MEQLADFLSLNKKSLEQIEIGTKHNITQNVLPSRLKKIVKNNVILRKITNLLPQSIRQRLKNNTVKEVKSLVITDKAKEYLDKLYEGDLEQLKKGFDIQL